MNLFDAWFKRGMGVMAALLAGLAALAGVYWRGRAKGREQERSDNAARLQMGADIARKEVGNVQEEMARRDDDGVARRLKSEWVRGASPDRD